MLCVRRFAHQLPVHQRHQHQNCQQVEGEQHRGDVIGKQTEERRHDQIAHIGAAHLDADDGLRILCAEMRRGGVDDAGVDGRTAQPYQHKPCQRKGLRTGQQQGSNAHAQHRKPQTDHLVIAQLQGQKAAGAPPHRDADIEQAGKAGSRLGGHLPHKGQVAAGPKPGGGLQCAVAEEAKHHFLRARQREYLRQGQRLGHGAVRGSIGAFMPQGQAAKKHGRKCYLEQGDVPVAAVPAQPAGKCRAHHHRADGGAHAPHTVQPTHVAAFVMQGNIVVQGGIHAARAQAVGDSPQAEHPEPAGDRKAEQRRSGHAHAEGGHPARAQCPGEPVAVQAGNDGAQRDDHGQNARVGEGNAQLGVHGGPCRPQQRIRQAKADKSQINDRQQKLCHGKIPPQMI